jgi:hypothetical protein
MIFQLIYAPALNLHCEPIPAESQSLNGPEFIFEAANDPLENIRRCGYAVTLSL